MSEVCRFKFKLLITILLIVCVTKPLLAVELTADEKRLYELIMQYRKEHNLHRIPISPSLTYVAQTHAKDVYDHWSEIPLGCNSHSWSNHGTWKKCDYYPDHRNAAGMWSKPSELTSYKGSGFEICHYYDPPTSGICTPERALKGWQSSPGHNSVIINIGIWADSYWKAIGIGMYKGVACVWFGKEIDPATDSQSVNKVQRDSYSAKPNYSTNENSNYTQWTKSMYNQYTYQNYTNYAPFTQAIDANNLNVALLEAAIFYETNRQRAKYGVQQLSYDHALYICAHNHSVDMVEHNFFSHKSPIAGKTVMKDRLSQVGYDHCWCSENIAYCAVKSSYAETARHLVEDVWMNSEGHRRNILNGNYTHLGCGAVFYYEGHWLMVKTTQNFLRK